MKKLLFVFAILLSSFLKVSAQGSLAGRVYYNSNIMEKELKDYKKESKDLSKEAQTQEEKEQVKGLDAVMDAIVSKMTVKFIDDKTAEMSIDVKFDEQKAKDGGASWMMRKMVKLKLGKGMSEKGQVAYTVNGRKVTIKSLKKKGKDKFLELSEDGKTLLLDMDKRKVPLKRIK
jgi:hypothetical protein